MKLENDLLGKLYGGAREHDSEIDFVFDLEEETELTLENESLDEDSKTSIFEDFLTHLIYVDIINKNDQYFLSATEGMHAFWTKSFDGYKSTLRA